MGCPGQQELASLARTLDMTVVGSYRITWILSSTRHYLEGSGSRIDPVVRQVACNNTIPQYTNTRQHVAM